MVSKKINNQSLRSYTVSAFHESFHLIFTSVLCSGWYYYLHFVDEEPEAQTCSANCPKPECVVEQDLSPEQCHVSS